MCFKCVCVRALRLHLLTVPHLQAVYALPSKWVLTPLKSLVSSLAHRVTKALLYVVVPVSALALVGGSLYLWLQHGQTWQASGTAPAWMVAGSAGASAAAGH